MINPKSLFLANDKPKESLSASKLNDYTKWVECGTRITFLVCQIYYVIKCILNDCFCIYIFTFRFLKIWHEKNMLIGVSVVLI